MIILFIDTTLANESLTRSLLGNTRHRDPVYHAPPACAKERYCVSWKLGYENNRSPMEASNAFDVAVMLGAAQAIHTSMGLNPETFKSNVYHSIVTPQEFPGSTNVSRGSDPVDLWTGDLKGIDVTEQYNICGFSQQQGIEFVDIVLPKWETYFQNTFKAITGEEEPLEDNWIFEVATSDELFQQSQADRWIWHPHYTVECDERKTASEPIDDYSREANGYQSDFDTLLV